MPRPPRILIPGYTYHLINRGNDRGRIFSRAGDFRKFISLLQRTAEVRGGQIAIYAYALMPNHYHLLASGQSGAIISRALQIAQLSFARYHHARYGSSGHVFQGRFKHFPVQPGRHFLTVMRYVERNALNGNLVRAAEDWPWTSLHERRTANVAARLLSPLPIPLPENWIQRVNQPLTTNEAFRLARSSRRGRPFGTARWTRTAARKLGLLSTLRRRGRPSARGKGRQKKCPDPF